MMMMMMQQIVFVTDEVGKSLEDILHKTVITEI